ncbi:MAG: ABC transporter ATP-binding protein [Sulfurifustaceae bacterium]
MRLETRALTLAAGGRILCRDLSLGFNAAENWAILGANGSGKTTLLHTLAGLRDPQAGSVLLDGVDIRSFPDRARALRIGLLFQDYPTTFPVTVLDTVLTGRHPHLGRFASEGETDVRCARDALAQVEMSPFETRLVPTLSGGERRRVEIAAVLAQDAPLCLWDEPTNHLDLRHQVQVLRRLVARAARPGHLNLFALHDINAAARSCRHALLLFPGGAWQAGPVREVLTCAALERMYGCRFRETVVDGNERFYFPV